MKKQSHKNTFSCFKNGDILAIVSEVPKSKKNNKNNKNKTELEDLSNSVLNIGCTKRLIACILAEQFSKSSYRDDNKERKKFYTEVPMVVPPSKCLQSTFPCQG